MQQIEHERRIQSRLGFFPERIICLCAFRRGIFNEVVDQFEYIRVPANVAKRVVAVGFGWVNQVKNTQHIPFFQKQISDGTEHFALWICANKAGICKHKIWFCEESRLARAGAADNDLQEISPVQLTVHTHLQVLGQYDVFACILVTVFFIQLPDAAPRRGAVFFTGAGVLGSIGAVLVQHGCRRRILQNVLYLAVERKCHESNLLFL